ncbi:WbqC family protein [Mucilaginibacter flavidus]|uniref:WbqC family protein n=1 Tax=Mucilaginibacter flavidus TaxID=2949309 RepID=UPI002092CD6C|nr:WbqC family protein [Mucilaginibacter flavidus]MCO5947235.1 WbqC family protein [Mucilaginibacter flavidus]
MEVAIMQPYIFPYIGYFQLINAVDIFIVYDNIKFTKKGWINRNRILVNGKDDYITLPLKKDSDFLNIDQRYLADNFDEERNKLLRRIKDAYQKAPYFIEAYTLVEKTINYEEDNLFKFIYNSLTEICKYLDIKTKFIISSTLPIDHELKSEDKVIALCKAVSAIGYLNPIGGVELYSKERFINNGIQLNFLKSATIEYSQFKNEFIPWLSIIDLMMFNSKDKMREFLQLYTKI